MPHNSGVTATAACNCGRLQSARDDPFNLPDANLKFYAEMDQECCGALERITMPIHKENEFGSSAPGESVSDSIAASGGIEKALEELELETSEVATTKNTEKKQTLADLATTQGMHRQISSGSVIAASLDPLPHMPTLDTSPGRLPMFTSWSLVQLGSSYLYHHTAGVTQPGFLPNSKHLLAWEVPLKNATLGKLVEKWPNLAEIALKKMPDVLDKNAPVKMHVKVFVGMEYECPRGHRFMASAPDRVMKQAHNPNRDAAAAASTSANKIVAADMPLYMGCPCRNSRPQLCAQLVRIHVVTPKAPLSVTLMPRVQPCPDGPVFHPGGGVGERYRLPRNSCWVLRLPYVYAGEEGSHVPPAEVPVEKANYGRLLKGALGFIEEYE